MHELQILQQVLLPGAPCMLRLGPILIDAALLLLDEKDDHLVQLLVKYVDLLLLHLVVFDVYFVC